MRIVDYDEFCSLEFAGEWKRLLRRQGTYDIGNTYEWNRCWWESYREEGPWKKHWFLLAHETRGEIDAIFPLVIRSRVGIRIVEFLGQSGGFMTDYLGSIGAADDRDRAVKELLDFLLANTDRWDLVSLRLLAWSNELPWYLRNMCLPQFAGKIQWKTEIPGYYVAVQLPRGFDEYLSSLGKRTRADVRRYLRIAGENGAALAVYRGDKVLEHVEVLCDLNSENWQVLKDSRGRRFMTEVSHRLVSAEEPLLLGVFHIGGQPYGAVQGFETASTCFLHTAGVVRRQIGGMSPGTTMYAMLIRSLIGRGLRTLDLSPGLEEYKLRLGGTAQPFYHLQLSHQRSRIARWRAFNWSRNAFYGARKRTRAQLRKLCNWKTDASSTQ
ncbi:GNAT family N-acetyltransferase [Planctomycetota bacterium]